MEGGGSLLGFQKEIKSLRDLRRLANKQALASKRWYESVRVTLVRLADAKIQSTAERERSFSALKRILTSSRTSMSDKTVADSLKVSLETKRRFGKGQQRAQVLTLKPRAL